MSDDVLINNQPIKKTHGGKRVGSGRKKGAIQKLGGVELLDAIERATGRPFADNIALHYARAIIEQQWNEVRDYEKFIINKVISDKNEVDITSAGEQLKAAFQFVPTEIADWKKPE